MGGPSPLYLAEHFLMPQLIEERGVGAILSAIDSKNADFFVPVWSRAGFRFTPVFLYAVQSGYRIGVLTFPQPTGVTEAYLGAVIGRGDDPKLLRYFLWEQSLSGTVVGEWNAEGHMSHGPGPEFSGTLQSDAWEFTKRVLAVL